MPHYTPAELIGFHQKGLRFFVVNADGSFGAAYADFGSAAKAGGLPTHDVAVVNSEGAAVVYDRQAPGFYDFGQPRPVVIETPHE
ncbi:hypothetical protein LMG26857_00384 [Achromobacter anxifer]|uniref:hypothetical protein n=1 Tax=Achromobacter anxifer TaxID=1287737 RepID=UPI00155D2D27|nr:hypothetical protein [Achromobacter anxifer]CAB5511100.1 hypothetical protein LMG26857_00384 [Achromobacter anxifer]